MQQHRVKKTLLLLTLLIPLCGFSKQEAPEGVGQPSQERKAQDALPQSHDDMWKMLRKCKVSLDYLQYKYSIEYTPEVKALEGKSITISGFMMPLKSAEKFDHFLLSKRTPTCFFCPPGEPNEIVEVFTTKPVTWAEGIVVATGTMGFTSNPELGLFFQMKQADVMDMKVFQNKKNQNF
jgi:uncharacterized protein